MIVMQEGSLVILILGLAYVLYSSYTAYKLTNSKRYKELREKNIAISNRFKGKSQSQITQEELKEFMDNYKELMKETLKFQFKMYLLILPLYLALQYIAIPFISKAYDLLPYAAGEFFFILVLISGLSISLLSALMRRLRKK
ncbi:MAG: hypothetical protein ARM1_0288 [Candidatus Micrarchaeota archaeon]|nr:MAG: hypothetical protein ARM1_0288 [Candidatus Micrarchaeota archaeon]